MCFDIRQTGEQTERGSVVTSVVDAGVELDDDGAAPDGLEEVRRRLHRAAAARAGLLASAAAATHLACGACRVRVEDPTLTGLSGLDSRFSFIGPKMPTSNLDPLSVGAHMSMLL